MAQLTWTQLKEKKKKMSLHKELQVLDGSKKTKGSQVLKGSSFPYLQFEGNTWRKQAFFKEAMEHYHAAGDKIDDNFMTVIKKVWLDLNTGTNSERKRMIYLGKLNMDYLLQHCTDECPCCGRVMWYGRVHNMVEGYQKPSVDRIDPDGDYTDSNVWIICNSCNTKKNNAKTPSELYRIAARWHEEIKNRTGHYEQYCNEQLDLEQFLKGE